MVQNVIYVDICWYMLICFVPPFCNWRRPFWGRNVLLSEAVYHVSYAQKNHQIPILESCYKREERKKKQAYKLDVERGTFTPLVFSTSSGMGRLARTFYARFAHLLSIKRQTRYAATMGLHDPVQISFSLMTAAIMCLRGARSSANSASRACDSIIWLSKKEILLIEPLTWSTV